MTSDLYRVELSSLTLKEPIPYKKELNHGFVSTLIVSVSVFVYADKVLYCISDRMGYTEAVDNVDFMPEDQRRVDWLISTARSMM